MTTKNVDWNAIQISVEGSLNKLKFNRDDLPAAFDLVRGTILDLLGLYIDKRHLGAFRLEIETADPFIRAHFKFEGETLCSWEI